MASNTSDHNTQVMDKSMNNSNVITITTSETLRIDGDRGNLPLQGAGAGGGQPFQKKKSSSFQITSITSRLSNDGGEDSADDTEDISDIMDSSKVTDLDQETPSFEEYSKSEEVFFGAPPVIPTSSQYGITALVQQTGSGGVMTAMLPQGVTVNVTEGGIALAKADGESDDVNHWQNRFKIVKIDSNEPFKRGRWICLDFMDSPAVTAAGSVKKDDGSTVVVAGTLLKDGEAADHQPQTVVQLAVPSQQQQDQAQQNQQQQSQQQPPQQQQQQPPQGQTSQAQQHSVPVPQQYQVPHTSQASTPMVSASQGAVPLQPSTHMPGVPTTQGQANLSYPPHSQPAPLQGQMQSQISQGYTPGTQAPGQIHPSPSPHTPPQAQQPPMQQPLQPPPLQQAPPQLQSQVSQPSVAQQPAVSASGGVMVPPTPLTQPPQHQTPMTSQSLPQQPPQQAPPQQGLSSQSVPQSGVMTQPGLASQTLQPGVMTSMPAQNLPKPGVPHQPTPVLSQPQASIPQKPVAQAQLSQPLPSKPLAGSQQLPPVAASQQLPVSQQVGANMVPATAPMGATQQLAPTSSATSAVKPSGLVPTPATTPAQPQTHHSMGTATAGAAGAPEQAQSSLAQPQKPPTNLEGIPLSCQPQEDAATNATPPAQQDDSESASTASTVAIDNKIEQAMDLVKSHLMFAVREEVEVLKEKITELLDRISQLEYENMVLRQCATQEALQKIQQHQHHASNT